MLTKRLNIFILIGFVTIASLFYSSNAYAVGLGGGCPGDHYLTLKVNAGGAVAVNGVLYTGPSSPSIKFNGSTTVTVDPLMRSGAGPDSKHQIASFSGYPATTKTVYFSGDDDAYIEAIFTSVINNEKFTTQILPDGSMKITAPDLPAGQKLSRADEVVVVQSPDIAAPAQPSIGFVKGDATTFTFKITPPSPSTGVASYVIESFVPDASFTRPDGKMEDIGQAFSAFAHGPVTATSPIPANSLPANGNYQLTGLSADTDYCFRVKAIGQNGHESLPSKSKCGKTPVALT